MRGSGAGQLAKRRRVVALLDVETGQEVARLRGARIGAVEALQRRAHLGSAVGRRLQRLAEGGGGRRQLPGAELRLAASEVDRDRERRAGLESLEQGHDAR